MSIPPTSEVFRISGHLPALHRPVAAYHVLRLSVAGMMFLHGIAKLRGGVADIEAGLASLGLPQFIAYGVYLGEVVAPLLVMINVLVAPAALVMVVNMLCAIALFHAAEVFALGSAGGWRIELQALYLFGSLVLAMLAPRSHPRDAAHWPRRRAIG